MSSVTGPVKILAIHAHPDDIELQCAGTLIRLKQKGCSISLATMTPGDCGSAELAPDEIAEVRRMEAVRSAELIGADYTCLEFRDLSIVHDNESRQRVTEVIRKTRPDIVITAPPVDYMSDHEMTSRLVRDACFNASCPNYVTHQWDPADPTLKIPHLYYVDAIQGIDYFGRPLPPDFNVRTEIENARLPRKSKSLVATSTWSGRISRRMPSLVRGARQTDWSRIRRSVHPAPRPPLPS